VRHHERIYNLGQVGGKKKGGADCVIEKGKNYKGTDHHGTIKKEEENQGRYVLNTATEIGPNTLPEGKG